MFKTQFYKERLPSFNQPSKFLDYILKSIPRSSPIIGCILFYNIQQYRVPVLFFSIKILSQ